MISIADNSEIQSRNLKRWGPECTAVESLKVATCALLSCQTVNDEVGIPIAQLPLGGSCRCDGVCVDLLLVWRWFAPCFNHQPGLPAASFSLHRTVRHGAPARWPTRGICKQH